MALETGPTQGLKHKQLFTNLSNFFRDIRLARNSHHLYHRDLEELLRCDFEVEELFGREYDDFLVERDAFDDLD